MQGSEYLTMSSWPIPEIGNLYVWIKPTHMHISNSQTCGLSIDEVASFHFIRLREFHIWCITISTFYGFDLDLRASFSSETETHTRQTWRADKLEKTNMPRPYVAVAVALVAWLGSRCTQCGLMSCKMNTEHTSMSGSTPMIFESKLEGQHRWIITKMNVKNTGSFFPLRAQPLFRALWMSWVVTSNKVMAH